MSPATRIRSGRRIPSYVWVPPTNQALYKLEVIRSDGTVDDITADIFKAEIQDGVTDTIGNFSAEVNNGDESRTGIWSGNETFNFYCDYATSATTKRFSGKIEKVSYQDHKIKIEGRSHSARLLDITVTKEYSSTETSAIIKDLFDSYATDFTYNNVNTSTTNVTTNFYQKPFWEALQELSRSAGFEVYVDYNKDCHYFTSGSVNNTTEAIVHTANLIEVGDFAHDYSLIKNRVIVYGAEVEGIQLVKTAQDSASISSNGVKELIIQDGNIVTESLCQEKADSELAKSKDPPLVGDVSSIGLATIQPGEKIRISAPSSNLPPNFYKIISYKHKIEGFMKTTVTIEKEPRKIYHVMRDTISKGQKLSETPNPNEMRYTVLYTFDSDSGTHSSTQITDGVLKTDGSSTGTWISDTTTAQDGVTAIELRVTGDALSGTTYQISTDGGATYTTIPSLKTQVTGFAPGTSIKLKIVLNSASTQIKSAGILYKT